MRKGFLASCAVLFLLVSVSTVSADSPVWKISRGDQHLFIGGTVHVLTSTDYPLPEAFETAYGASSIIVFEADIQELQLKDFQQKLLARTSYPEGQNLMMFLTEDTQNHFKQYLASRQIPMENLVKFKAGMVSITLTMVELQRLGLAGSGVDQFFSLRALNDAKEIGHLETADEQLSFIAAMGEGKEDELIAYTLRQMEDLPGLLQSMKEAWRVGDNDKLEELALKSMQEEFPAMNDLLITQRNAAWMPKIEAMFETDEVEFVLVGALHLVGEDGVLKQLQDRGYAVQMQ